jgi:hypothetical protein
MPDRIAEAWFLHAAEAALPLTAGRQRISPNIDLANESDRSTSRRPAARRAFSFNHQR